MKKRLVILLMTLGLMVLSLPVEAHHTNNCGYVSPTYYSMLASWTWTGECHCLSPNRVVTYMPTWGFGPLDSTGTKQVTVTSFSNWGGHSWPGTEFDQRTHYYRSGSFTILHKVVWKTSGVSSAGDMRVHIGCSNGSGGAWITTNSFG